MMPGISGFEALEKIRVKSNVPILMLTAKDDSASKVRGLRQGADDYLTKSVIETNCKGISLYKNSSI